MAKVNITVIETTKPAIQITRTEVHYDTWNDEYVAYVYPKHWKGKAKRIGSYYLKSSAQRAINKYKKSLAA
jgi:hypothetical protein